MKYILLLFCFLTLLSCNETVSDTSEAMSVTKEPMSSEMEETSKTTGSIPMMSFDELEEAVFSSTSEQVYVVNFWATWCKPCVKELPYFEQLTASYPTEKVKVVLVSLDFPEKLESQVVPFVEKRNIQSEVILLNDSDANRWIPLVSEEWSGAIPATVIYNKNKRKFYEGSFTFEELEKELQSFL